MNLYSLDVVKELLDSNKITKYQGKGMLLEIAVYNALVNMGIYPIPLHNPFDDDYARDQHLGIDLIFRHLNRTFGVECKNLKKSSIDGYVNKEWIQKNVVNRFSYVEKTVPLDIKILVSSYSLNYLPLNIQSLILNYEATLHSLNMITRDAENLFSSLFTKINPKTSNSTQYGYRVICQRERRKLKRIDVTLRKVWEQQIEGWVEDA